MPSVPRGSDAAVESLVESEDLFTEVVPRFQCWLVRVSRMSCGSIEALRTGFSRPRIRREGPITGRQKRAVTRSTLVWPASPGREASRAPGSRSVPR